MGLEFRPAADMHFLSAFVDCKAPIDVILRSFDGKQFAAHKSYLGTYTGGFPLAEMTQALPKPEVVELEEKADVLLLLLQFAHPERPPSTTSLQPELIIRLSEAVEKYVAYGAMEVCRLRMRCVHLWSSAIYVDSNSFSLVASDIAAKEPFKAFRFAIKYGDANLRNHCAPLTVNCSVEIMRAELKGLECYFPALVAWVCTPCVLALSCFS